MKWKRLTLLCSLLLCFGLSFAGADWELTNGEAIGKNLTLSSLTYKTGASVSVKAVSYSIDAQCYVCYDAIKTTLLDRRILSTTVYSSHKSALAAASSLPQSTVSVSYSTSAYKYLEPYVLSSGNLYETTNTSKSFTSYRPWRSEISADTIKVGMFYQGNCPHCGRVTSVKLTGARDGNYYAASRFNDSTLISFTKEQNAYSSAYTTYSLKALGVKSYTVSGLNIFQFQGQNKINVRLQNFCHFTFTLLYRKDCERREMEKANHPLFSSTLLWIELCWC